MRTRGSGKRIDEGQSRMRAVGRSAVVQFGFIAQCHPERSRFSGVAKDLPLNRHRASAKPRHNMGFLGWRFLLRKVACHLGGLVIAPCEADDTNAAYLANTPVG